MWPQPRIIVRDASDQPVAGRYCTVHDRDAEQPGLLGVGEIEVLRLTYTCGPSDEHGVIELKELHVAGGATRPLNLSIKARARP